MKNIFLIIGKYPSAGFSKTRLAKDWGDTFSTEIYRAMIDDFSLNLKNCLDKSIPVIVAVTPATIESKNYFQNCFPQAQILFQADKPFFQRIRELIKVLNENGECFIHLTGTDLPHFPFRFLNFHDDKSNTVRIGPDLDGGFYYTGFSSKYFELFDIDIKEGNSSIFEILKAQALKLGHEVECLEKWSDIDTLEDLKMVLDKHHQIIPSTYKVFKKFQAINS